MELEMTYEETHPTVELDDQLTYIRLGVLRERAQSMTDEEVSYTDVLRTLINIAHDTVGLNVDIAKRIGAEV